jgi:hypothetical protein
MNNTILFAFGFLVSAITAAGIYFAAIERLIHDAWERHEKDGGPAVAPARRGVSGN